MSDPLHDLLGFDRDIARAHEALSRWRIALAADPAKNAEMEPFWQYRHVAGQRAYDAVREHPVDEPLKSALLGWVHALTEARVLTDLDIAWAATAAEPAARLSVGTPRMVSFAQARRGMVTSLARPEALAWLAAAAARGPHLGSIARQRAERRVEVAHRLDLLHPTDKLVATPPAVRTAAAEAILRETSDMWSALYGEARAKAGLGSVHPSPVDAIAIAVGRDAPEGWPAQLTSRWLSELFGPLARGLRIDLPALPSAIGAASFARALGSFGFALRVAGRAPSLPFALACAPAFVDAHRYAWVFAGLAATPQFQRRALGVSSRVAEAQSRVLALSGLFAARVAAGRALLSSPSESVSASRFEEITFNVFGAPLPPELRSAWPSPRDDESARFLAVATATPLARDLVERFDLDWYANPRATEFLRARASGPAWDDGATPALDPAAAARSLAREFESVLA